MAIAGAEHSITCTVLGSGAAFRCSGIFKQGPTLNHWEFVSVEPHGSHRARYLWSGLPRIFFPLIDRIECYLKRSLGVFLIVRVGLDQLGRL